MDQKQFKTLSEKYLQGKTTVEETRMLYEWYESFDDTLIYLEEEELQLKNRLWEKLRPDKFPAEIAPEVIRLKKRANSRLWYAAAAVLFLAISIAIAISFRHDANSYNLEMAKAAKFRPGANKAILTLSNGKAIVLAGQETKEVRDKGNRLIAHNEKKELDYQVGRPSKAYSANETNTLTTARGGQYKVVLPDGTQVWLNAASSITYPLAFRANERKVEMTGEAYFEVAKDAARPFRVYSGKQVVEVLGTHFNINAYPDEPAVKTTLLEGKVKVTAGSNQLSLIPGEQSQMSIASLTLNQGVDLEEITAWRNGYFVFNHEHIESIMRKISRWYDVDVEYKGPVSEDWFGGTVSRDKDASETLRKLELTGQIHFKIEGRRIIVMQ
jgi:ferric-dicitrate binding protein FerR (iron transport regulator)